MDERSGSGQRIILVHGTGATAASDIGSAWWQTEHPLRAALLLATDGAVPVEAFIWSGANSEAERCDAGRRLCARIEQLAGQGISVHLIGHSHGGSVIWHALQQLDRRKGKFAQAIASWATVGTPFLIYGMRRARLTLALIVMALASVCIGLGLWSLQRTEIAYAWRDDPVLTALWGGLALLPLLIFAWAVRLTLPFVAAYLRRRRRHHDAVHGLGQDRYLGLWSTEDEPTIGLGATGSVSIRLLREFDGASRGLRLRERLFHPVSAAVNQFVNNVLARAFQGSTIAFLELQATDNAPHPMLAHKSLPHAVDRELIDSANRHAAALGSRARELLVAGASPLTGFADLQRAAAKSMNFRELVHTSYFDNAFCIDVLVHHLRQHCGQLGAPAAAGQPPPEVESFYNNRGAQRQPQQQRYATLPSNRAAYLVALASLGAAAVLALLMLAQGSVHRQVLAPTMPDAYLADLATAATLGSVLATTVPAETLETAASSSVYIKSSNEKMGLPDAQRDAQANEELFQSQKILRPYLRNLMAAGKEADLLAAVAGLESAGLRSMFYLRAWPLLLEFASGPQLERLLTVSPAFPGAPQIQFAQGGVYSNAYFSIYVTLDALARAGKLSPDIYRKLQLACGQSGLCLRQVQLQYAYALVKLNLNPDPVFLKPLPAPRLLAPIMAGDSSRQSYQPLLPFPTSDQLHENARLVRWLARNGEWEHLAVLQVQTAARVLDWNDVAEPARLALATLKGEQLNWFLKVVFDGNWKTAPPAQFAAALQAIAARRLQGQGAQQQNMGPSDYDVPMFSDAALRTRFTEGKQRRACAIAAAGPPPSSFEAYRQEMEGQLDPCRDEKLRTTMASLNPNLGALFAVQKNLVSDLDGKDGVFARLAHPIDRSDARDGAGVRLALLLKTMDRAACAGYANAGAAPAGLDEEDGTRLAKALAMLGPASEAARRTVAGWLASDAYLQRCPGYDKENTDARDSFLNWRQHFIYYLATWLDPQHPQLARAALRRAVNDAAIVQYPDDKMMTRYAAWFLMRKEPLEALSLTQNNRDGNLLLRRAAFYQIAACQLSAGEEKNAAATVTLARVSGAAAATLGSPLEMIAATEAESRYHALRRDWRRSRAACSRCDERTRIAVAVDNIPLMAAEMNGEPLPRAACPSIAALQLASLVKEETSAVCGAGDAALSFRNGRIGCESKATALTGAVR